MLDEIKQLLENQGQAFADFKNRNDERMTLLEKELEQLAKRANRPGAPGGGGRSTEDIERLNAFIRAGATEGLQLERKAGATTVSDPGGGYMVPTEIDRNIGEIRRKMNPMRQICRVLKPETPDWKKLVSTTDAESGWVGETQARPETDSPELGMIQPAWGEVYANPKASQKMLDDAGFDVEDWFNREVSKKFAKDEGEAFITGSGVLRPRGILTRDFATTADAARPFGTIQYIASGNAGALPDDADPFLDLIYSLNSQYRMNARWMMNSLTIASIRKFKDGEGNYLWHQGLELGQPNLFLGYPVVENDFMPDVDTDTYPVLFGDFEEGFWIFDRPTTMIRDPYSAKPFVHFYTSARVGTLLNNSEAVKALKASAT